MRRSTTRGRQGDWLVVDDRSGFTHWASECQKEWNGALVHRRNWEARHPQEFVRAVKDDMRVDPARPRPVDVYAGPLITQVTADASAGSQTIQVLHADRFLAGDRIGVTLANNDIYRAVVEDIDVNTLLLVAALPNSVASGSVVVNYTAVSPARTA